MIELMDHQKEPLEKLSNGKILNGGVGSGKSIVALAYYAQKDCNGDLIVITTAKKRDTLEWEADAAKFGIFKDRETSWYGTITVDSWNNISKYVDRKGCTFIFDEQRLVGYGKWVKSFLKIAREPSNLWLLLTATPGDTWLDYAPVFIANGFYKNITQFKDEHVIYGPHSRFPKVKGYIGQRKLERYKEQITVEMPFLRHTTRVMEYVDVPYDEERFKEVAKRRWNIYTEEPCRDFAELFRVLRRLSTSHPGRLEALREIMAKHPRIVVFYIHNYELEALRTLADEIPIAEWNGMRKQEIPDTDRWLYLVQYASGSEGWNCTSTDTMVFYGLTYSYKNFEQAQGRIDRLNTPFYELYYYVLAAKSWTDQAILRSLEAKKDFNERLFGRENGELSGGFG